MAVRKKAAEENCVHKAAAQGTGQKKRNIRVPGKREEGTSLYAETPQNKLVPCYRLIVRPGSRKLLDVVTAVEEDIGDSRRC